MRIIIEVKNSELQKIIEMRAKKNTEILDRNNISLSHFEVLQLKNLALVKAFIDESGYDYGDYAWEIS
jgi:hypothetical protein